MAIDQVIQEVKKLDRMSGLPLEKFAEEGGYADQVAQAVKDDLKPTQLRKVFHTLKQIEMNLRRENPDAPFSDHQTKLLTLTPELAYARGRGLLPQKFYELLRECLKASRLQTVGDFRRCFAFVEAILAYHKYHNP